MGSLITKNIIRFVFIVLIQGLVLAGLTLNYPILNHTNVIIYPLVILLLPVRMPKAAVILVGFTLGLALDFFYNSPGIHASASVVTAFLRPYIMSRIEPRGGYSVEASPTMHEFGSTWFLMYSGILLIIHLFFLFSVQAFTFAYILEILLKTILSFIISMIFIQVYMYLFNPRE